VPKTLACIHTSMVFVKVETMMDDLFREIMPDVKRMNIVDDSLLPHCMGRGEVTPALVRRMSAYVQCAADAGADAVLSLCSSLGPSIDVARRTVGIPVIKIDDGMAERAASTAARMAVLATVPTTLGPTCDLIRAKAAAGGKTIDVRPALAEGAFDLLMKGERDAHDDRVAAAAREAAGADVEILVLAQASMTRLAPRLEQLIGKPVLSSPRLGIEHTRRILDSL